MTSFLLGLLGNIISSFLFLLAVLWLLRPKISVCSQIAMQKNAIEGEPVAYFFKIVNKSLFDAFDIQLELSKMEHIKVSKEGINERITDVELKHNEIKHIMPYMTTSKCKKRNYAKHAILFRSFQNLSDILKNENETLELQITLRHGLTGLSRVYKSAYIDSNDIIEGTFEFGNSLNIRKK